MSASVCVSSAATTRPRSVGVRVRQRLGDVVLVVVREERSQLCGPLRAADGTRQLDRVILLKKQILLQVVSSFCPKMGIKYTASR